MSPDNGRPLHHLTQMVDSLHLPSSIELSIKQIDNIERLKSTSRSHVRGGGGGNNLIYLFIVL
jgi:hypothetical protein